MGIDLPPELHWLEWIVGSDWPEGDEDALWRMKDAFHAAAQDVQTLLSDGDSAYYRVLSGVGGSVADNFTAYWQQYSEGDQAYLTQLVKLCEGLAEHCDQTALQIEYAKYQFIIALIVLAIQIAYMLAMAAPSFGASTAGIPVAEVATQSFIRVIAQNVIRTMIFMVVQNVLSDVVIQMVQIGEGHRSTFDGSKTVSAAVDGAISGVVFGAAGGAVHIGGAKIAPDLAKTLLGKLGEGAAINVVGSLGLAAATGQDLSFDNLAKTATAGMAMSWGGHGEHPSTRPESEQPRLGRPMETDFAGGGQPHEGTHIPAYEPHHLTSGEPVRTGFASETGTHTVNESASGPPSEPPAPTAQHIQNVLSGEPTRPVEATYHETTTTTEPTHHQTTTIEPTHHQTTTTTEPTHHQTTTTTEPTHETATRPVETATGGRASDTPATSLAGAGSIIAPEAVGRTEPATRTDSATRTEPAQAAGHAGAAPVAAGVAPVAGPVAAPATGPRGPEPTGGGAPTRTAPTIPTQRAEPPRFGYEPGHGGVEPPVVVPTPEPAPSLEPASGLAHEEAFADRGVHPDDVAWSGEGRTLNSVENAAADGFLAHAYQAEQQITPRMRELAQDTGGQLHGEEYSRKSEESFKRKLSDEIYRESPGHTLDQQLANMKDAVRYTVGFGSEHYTEGAQRVVDHLVTARDEHGQARYELVKFKNTWGTDEGYVGINSFWKDNATGQVFELQIHSEHSFAAKMETHGPYETARTTDDPVLKRQMEMEANARFAEVPRPEGAVNIRTPDEASTGGRPPEQPTQAGRPAGEQPTSGTPPGMLDRGVRPAEISEHQTPDGHEHRDEPDAHDQTPESAADDTAVPSPFVSDVEAVQIVRDHLHSTPAGYAFYPEGDRTLRFAEAVQPREGVVTLDLHGSPDGFHINGRVLSGEQFARAVEVMRQEGRIQVGEHQQIRLAACDIARGENSPAAQFARESGHPVTAPTERLWTNMRGEERVSSAVLRDGRWVPAEPENGRWRTFGPDGVERTPPEQPSTPTVGEQRPGRDTPRTTTGPPAEHGLPHDPTQARADHERSAPESHGDAAHEEAQREAPAHEEAQHEEAQHEAPTHAPAELSVETIEREYGVPERNQQRLQAFADEHGVVIDLRPTNPESVRWLDEGALPKPQSIKAKTISELDVMLGADPERVGLVGYFEPELPRRPEGMPEGEWGALEKRYNQRLTEFAELSGSMAKLEHAGQISVRDGVVYGKDESGGFRPITGDHDVFDIRRPDGQRLSGAEYDQLVQEMRARNMGVQHGAHMYWEPEGAFNTRIYQDIVERHQPGGEPLVRFGPGEQPHLVDATTPVEREPREAPHGESDIPASGDEFQARSGTDPPGGTQLAGADPRRLDELAAQATRSTLPEGVRGQAKAEAYVLADRLGLIGNEPAVVERRAALAEQLPERTRRFLEHPDLTEADRARVARVEARAEFEQGGGRVEEALRHAASLNELYEAGIRPHEIAQAATPENMRRVFPGLDEPGAHNLAELLHDPKVTQMLRESWGSPPYEPPLLAESVLRKLAEHPDLVKMMVDVPDLRNALAGRPMTLDHLATHQEAIDTLHRVVDEIHERGPEAVADEPVGDPPPTPLTQEQGRLSAEIHPKRGQDRQTGFEYRRRGDDTYRAEYLDRLYADAVPAQRELKTMAQEIAAQTNGEAGAREEPKDRRRAEDKVEGYKKNASRLNDLAAAKIAYDNLADLYHALDQVKSYPGAKIVMFDDRFARPQPSGYRDIQMSVRTSNGHVGEFRLHLKSMDEVAHWEHSLYEVRRDLRTLEKARPLTPTEVAIRNGLIREEQRLFWEALQPALPEGGS